MMKVIDNPDLRYDPYTGKPLLSNPALDKVLQEVEQLNLKLDRLLSANNELTKQVRRTMDELESCRKREENSRTAKTIEQSQGIISNGDHVV